MKGNKQILPKFAATPPKPIPPTYNELEQMSDLQKLHAIQQFINRFEYNYSGKPFVKMKRTLGAAHVFSCAEEIMTVALPIQCVEATFIALYLTCGHLSLTRIPLSFKSCFQDGPHRHMVLAVRTAGGLWGTLGISRRQDLMDKPCRFNSLFELVLEYKRSYENNYHRLGTVYVGLPFTHQMVNNRSHGRMTMDDPPVQWKALKIKLPRGRLLLEEHAGGGEGQGAATATIDGSATNSEQTKAGAHEDGFSDNTGSVPALTLGSTPMLQVRERCDLFSHYIAVT